MMSPLVSFVASYAINAAWEVPLIGGAGWAVSCLLKKIGAYAQHRAWVASLALSVLAPALAWCRRFLGPIPNSGRGYEHSSILVAPLGFDPNVTYVAMLPTSLVFLVFLVYMTLLAYFAARLVWSMFWTAGLLRDSRLIMLNPKIEEYWNRCKRSFSVEDGSIRSSQRIAGPVTLGWAAPILLVPEGFDQECTHEEFFSALAHECAHMKRGDFRKNLIYEIVSLVIAFHPVTWILKSKIAQTREMICDDMAVQRFTDPHTYTKSLLGLATRISHLSQVSTTQAIGIFDANVLEERIMTIMTIKPKLSSAAKCGWIVSGALLMFGAAAVGTAAAVVVKSETPSQAAGGANSYGQVYQVGKDVTAPKLISSVEPEFPAAAQKGKDKFDGTSLIGFVVDKTGTPRDVKVLRSLGPDFDDSAVKAVQLYRFIPAMRSGEPVAVALKVEVNFKKF
jgi:TonB family protein